MSKSMIVPPEWGVDQPGALVRHLAVGLFRVVGPPYDVNGDRVLVKVLNQAASTAAAPFPSAG